MTARPGGETDAELAGNRLDAVHALRGADDGQLLGVSV
jgi:hypothetical protein